MGTEKLFRPGPKGGGHGDINRQINRLKEEELVLLRSVISCRQPDLSWLVDTIGKRLLSVEERESLREVLGDELCATGLTESFTPNQRGLVIENLIDRLWYVSKQS